MRVLWITNILFPAIAEKMRLPKTVFGGWMYSSAKRLVEANKHLKLAVATVYNGAEFQAQELEGVLYFLLPLNDINITRYNKTLEKHWKNVTKMFDPQLVHIHGTEYNYGLAFLRACPNIPAVASIQGMVSCYARYYLAGLTTWDLLKSITLRDLLLGTLWSDKRSFKKRGVYEVEMIRHLKHVIGRTSWDRAHAISINPNISYHFCNETLRDSFYDKTWTYDNCEKHSIFISQAGYPIKGFHQLLKAMPFILKQFPETKIYVAGTDITRAKDGFVGKLLRTGYGRYVSRLIKKYNLEHSVIFTGSLNEERMCQQYLRSNVFVCPSAIENSPNSLGEAQILGVPCVVSYVGGSMDMMEGNEENLYRFEEIEMLAIKICRVFSECREVNLTMQNKARARHNGDVNSTRLYQIYKELLQ